MITPEVAAKLDQNRCYGLWWFNKTHNVSRQVVESTPNGLRYRKRKKVTPKPESEQIAVPVPASGIPREWVDAARANIRDNRQTSSNGGRFWELSGGVAWCELCGGRMQTGVVPKKNGRQHLYYRCWRRTRYGGDGCPRSAHHKAWEVEAKVWEYVRTT